MKIPCGITGEQRLSNGVAVRFRHFPPAEEPRGYVIGLHGIQSHSGWYGRSGHILANAGFDVRLFDRRGSGRSEGQKGHAIHWRRLVADVIAHLSAVRAERDRVSPDAPVILMGISWGGRLAAAVAAERPELIDGLMLLAPGLYSRMDPGLAKRIALRIARLAGIRNRLFPIPLNDPALFTDDPGWQHFIAHDPLSLRRITVGFLNASEDLRKIAQSSTARIRCPVLIVLAGRDRIVDNAKTQSWFRRLSAPERTLSEFLDAVHTHEFDPCFDGFVAALVHWLGNRAPTSNAIRRSA